MSFDLDRILRAFNAAQVRYLLIGGVNFSIRHIAYATYDVDLWVADTEQNLRATQDALTELGAEWGPTEDSWKSVPNDFHWLQSQQCFCMTTEAGALDIFRDVFGLEGRFDECHARAVATRTPDRTPFMSLADEDMLRCQESLPPGHRDERRIQYLRATLGLT
jgi:hypothetical protein